MNIVKVSFDSSKMPKILEAESHLDVEALVDEAVKGVEIIHLP